MQHYWKDARLKEIYENASGCKTQCKTIVGHMMLDRIIEIVSKWQYEMNQQKEKNDVAN